MANWVIRNSEAFFHPMYKYFHRKLLERGFVMANETPLQVPPGADEVLYVAIPEWGG